MFFIQSNLSHPGPLVPYCFVQDGSIERDTLKILFFNVNLIKKMQKHFSVLNFYRSLF